MAQQIVGEDGKSLEEVPVGSTEQEKVQAGHTDTQDPESSSSGFPHEGDVLGEPTPEPESSEASKEQESQESKESQEAPPKFKYKSQEEAELAYGESERKMHEATTKASDATKQNEILQKALVDQAVRNQADQTDTQDVRQKIEQEYADDFAKIDWQDPDAGKTLARLNSQMADKLFEHSISSRTTQQSQADDAVNFFKTKLDAEQLGEFYDDFEAMAIRMLGDNPAFGHLNGDQQFNMVLPQLKTKLKTMADRIKASKEYLQQNSSQGSGMGRSGGNIPMKPREEDEGEDAGLGSLAEDMKAANAKKTLPVSAF